MVSWGIEKRDCNVYNVNQTIKEAMTMSSKKLRITIHEVAKANDRLKAKATKTLGTADKSVRRAIAGIDDSEIKSSWRKAAQRHEEAL